jgi:hypothetical protein
MLRTVALLGILAWQAVAGPVPSPPDLPAAIQRQVAARETLKTQAEDGQAALRKWYEASLDAIRVDAAGKADLDTVLATDTERGRMDRDLTAAESAALPKVLRDLRVRYDQARLARSAPPRGTRSLPWRSRVRSSTPAHPPSSRRSRRFVRDLPCAPLRPSR